MNTQEILNEREKTHGSFSDNAEIMQALKDIARKGKNWNTFSNVQKEATEMILHKLGRALTGNQNEPDHFADVAGYAELVVHHLHEQKKRHS